MERSKINQSRRELLKDVKQNLDIKPQKYYAIIVMDGDKMGEKLGEVKDAEEHKNISKKLNEFTEKARAIVESDKLGKLLYAGGDDVMALANLDHLFDIIEELRKKFTEILGDGYTLSGGVAIAHVKTPLNEALKWARRMEHKAKHIDEEKNAIGFSLLKHSGNIAETVLKWQYDTKKTTIQLAQNVIISLGKMVSNKFMYSLREEFLSLLDPEINPDLIEVELKRLITRAKKDEEDKKTKWIDVLANDLSTILSELHFTDIGIRSFFDFLEICNFIARKE